MAPLGPSLTLPWRCWVYSVVSLLCDGCPDFLDVSVLLVVFLFSWFLLVSFVFRSCLGFLVFYCFLGFLRLFGVVWVVLVVLGFLGFLGVQAWFLGCLCFRRLWFKVGSKSDGETKDKLGHTCEPSLAGIWPSLTSP